MKTLLFVKLIALASALVCGGETTIDPAALARLPLLEFKRDADFNAEIHRAPEGGFSHLIEGRPHIGFRFQTPTWIDGSVEWLTFAQPALAGEWWIFDAEAASVSQVRSQPVENRPDATRTSIAANDLKGGTIYAVMRPLVDGESPPTGIAITVNSVRGKYALGELSRNFALPERLRTPRQVLDRMLEIRKEQGNAAGVAHLADELKKRARLNEGFSELYPLAWRNAQRGDGRDDPEWGSMIFEEIFTQSLAHYNFTVALDVFGNLISTLVATERHGRAAELLAWWEQAQRAGGYVMTPSAYPDLGPALQFLPEVRRRKIPNYHSNPAASSGEVSPQPTDYLRFSSAYGFIHYSAYLGRAGKWRDAMEWQNWLIELTEGRQDGKITDDGSIWHHAMAELITASRELGFHEQALQLAEKGNASNVRCIYRRRSFLFYQHYIHAALLDLDRLTAANIPQLEEVITRMKDNREIKPHSWRDAEVTLAKALIFHGRVAEGEALLDRLVGDGHRNARVARVIHWIRTGRSSGVEQELISLLKHSRESGNKFREIELYRLYADFLESQGRLDEALAMRREAIRLCRSFDYFTFLPGELAKLAILLDRLGNHDEAETAMNEANGLLARNRLPAQLAAAARTVLANFTPRMTAAKDEEGTGPRIDFQPTRSVVIPIEGAACSTHLTLANPSTRTESGSLRAEGLPVHFSENAESSVVTGTLGAGDGASAAIPLRIEAGSYRLIALRGRGETSLQGEIKMTWITDRDQSTATSNVILEAPESGVLSSLIQAGEYKNNPYYGIPILHTYVSRNPEAKTFPLRLKTSAPARVEVYAFDGTPLCIDSQGNGSLRDHGDELFGASDQQGNLSMAITNGEAAFMVVLYPQAPLLEEGLLLDVEIFDGKNWNIHAQNRLTP